MALDFIGISYLNVRKNQPTRLDFQVSNRNLKLLDIIRVLSRYWYEQSELCDGTLFSGCSLLMMSKHANPSGSFQMGCVRSILPGPEIKM